MISFERIYDGILTQIVQMVIKFKFCLPFVPLKNSRVFLAHLEMSSGDIVIHFNSISTCIDQFGRANNIDK